MGEGEFSSNFGYERGRKFRDDDRARSEGRKSPLPEEPGFYLYLQQLAKKDAAVMRSRDKPFASTKD